MVYCQYLMEARSGGVVGPYSCTLAMHARSARLRYNWDHMSLVHPREERSVIPLILTVFIDLLGLGIAIPVLAVVLLDPHIGILPREATMAMRTISYGLLLASFPLAQFFGAPILGALSDRYGRKPILLLSLFGTAAGYALFGLGIAVNNLLLLFLSRILQGFAGGNLSIALSAIADVSHGEKKTHNFGLVGLAFGLGLILGPFFGGKLADPRILPWFDYATPFWFASGLTLVNLILCAWIFHETLHSRTHTPITPLSGVRHLIKAFTLPGLRRMFAVIFLTTLGFNFFTQFFQLFLIQRFGFTESDIGDFIAYTGLWVAISQGLLLRPLTRRLKPRTIFAWCTFLLGICFPLLLLPERSAWLYLLVPFLAVFYGISQPVSTTIVSDMSGARSQGEMMGINQSVQSMGMAIPPIIAGFVASIHVTLPILAAGVCTLVGWAVFIAFYPRRKLS